MNKIIKILVFLCITSQIYAQKITTEEIFIASENFISQNSDLKDLQTTEKLIPIFDSFSKKNIAYVLNLYPQGFIVFSADKKIYPVIAYSNENNFDFAKSDNNLLLNILEKDLSCLYNTIQDTISDKSKSFINNNKREWDNLLTSITPKVSIVEQYGPWIPSVWGSVNCKDENGNYIYVPNYFTPNHYSSGCVAVSLSQIIYRYEWPIHGVGTHTDYDNSGSSQGSYYANFDATYYDWANMLDLYMNLPSTDTERRACGMLHYHCGVALDMEYESAGSTSNINLSPNALSSYFRYIGHYETSSWSSFWTRLDDNLENGMPVQLGVKASSNGAQHAIATDGYRLMSDGSKYYHLNMGFWGTCNAWYRINVSFNSCGYDIITGGVFDILPEPEIIAKSENNTCDVKTFNITWSASKKIDWDCFELQQSDDGGTTWTTLSNTITDTSYLVTVPNAGHEYQYRVRTKYNNSWYASSYSNILSVFVKDDLTYLDFDGDDSFYINDNDPANLDVTNTWTFEFWINADNLPVSYPVIFDRRYRYTMYMLADGTGSGDYAVKFVARNNADAITASVSSEINDDLYFGKWYHIAVSNDGTTTKLFVNGTLSASSTDVDFNFTPSTKTFNVGARYWDSGYERYFNGKLDELIISKTARYVADFTPDRYDRPTPDTNTLIQLNLDKGYGTYVYDAAEIFAPIALRTSPNLCNWNYAPYRTNWTGTISTDWNNSANWSDGLPDEYTNARILSSATFQPTISGSANVKNIFIERNSDITVSPASYLKVSGMLCNSGNISILSPNDSTQTGALIDTGYISGCGTYDAQRFFKGGQWNFFSSPVQTATTEQFTNTGNPFNPNIYWYDETDNSDYWINGWTYAYENNTAPGNFNIMQGYAFYHPTSDFMANFSGQFNSDTFTINTTFTPAAETFDHEGWNFIGNPYPSAIDWDAVGGWDKNNIDNTIYFWNGYNYSYYVGTGGNIYGTGINNATNIIPPMQGFMVKSTADGYLQVNNKARTVTNHDTYKQITQPDVLILSLNYQGLKDETAIRFAFSTMDYYEGNYDALKLISSNGNIPQIYSFTQQDSLNYAINTLNSDFYTKQVNLGLKCNKTGIYSINTELNQIEKNTGVFLYDLVENKKIDLRKQPEYYFKYNNTDFNNRFYLEFVKQITTSNNSVSQNNIKIYSDGNKIYAFANNQANISIFDVTGRQVYNSQFYNNVTVENLKIGIYVVKVNSNNVIKTQKIIIK